MKWSKARDEEFQSLLLLGLYMETVARIDERQNALKFDLKILRKHRWENNQDTSYRALL
jgi:hypothetical protein